MNLLSRSLDLKFEKSALQKLADDLSQNHHFKMELLVMSKYHCELAGEGIEYIWACSRNFSDGPPHLEKKVDFFKACIEN